MAILLIMIKWAGSFPADQRLVDQTLVDADHLLQRGAEILQVPLQNQGNLDADETRQNEIFRFQLRRIQEGQNDLVLLPQEVDALVDQQRQQIVADDDIKQALLFFPEVQVEGNGIFRGGIFRKVGSHTQDAGMQFPSDDGPEAAVLVRKVVIKGFPGDSQLVAKVGNTNRRIGSLQKIIVQTLFNLPLTAVGGGGTGKLCMIHFFLQFGTKVQSFLQICILYRKGANPSIPGEFSNLSKKMDIRFLQKFHRF